MELLCLLTITTVAQACQQNVLQEPALSTYGLMAPMDPAAFTKNQPGYASFTLEPLESLEQEPLAESVPWTAVETLAISVAEEQPDLAPDLAPEVVVAPSFSPTVTLEGKTVLGLSRAIGADLNESTALPASIELTLNVSFTGEDRLQVGFESGSATEFSYVEEITFEGQLDTPSGTDDQLLQLNELSYEFPVGAQASVYLSVTGDSLEDFNPVLGDSSNGALSEFGSENPIHSLVGDVGLQLNYALTDTLDMNVGYFADDAGEPEPEEGLFNGNYSAFAQLGFEPNDRFLLGLTYIHTYQDSDLETDMGSLRAQINLERPVVGNSYGIAASFSPSSRLTIGGWVGLTHAIVLDLGNAEVWNYALTLAFPDLGREGNLLGMVIGQEPRLARTTGFKINDRRNDPNASFHIETFYSHTLSEQIAITPGFIWITAPNHDQRNPDIFIFTVRAAFEF